MFNRTKINFILLLFLLGCFNAQAFTNAYITNQGSGTVSVIDIDTNSVIKTIDTQGAFGVSISSSGLRAYVTSPTGSVSIIDTILNSVLKKVEVGRSPYGIAVSPDGNKIYVANADDDKVSVIDGQSYTILKSIAVGNYPYGVAISPDGQFIYVTNLYDHSVSIIDGLTDTVVGSITSGNFPSVIKVSPNGHKIYVSNRDGISVIDPSTNSVIANIFTGSESSPYGIALTPDGSKIYVSIISTGSVSTIDALTNTITGNIAVGPNPRGIQLTPDGLKAYVTIGSNNSVSIIDMLTDTVEQSNIEVGYNPISLGDFIAHVSVLPPPTTPSNLIATAAINSIILNFDGSTGFDGSITYKAECTSSDGGVPGESSASSPPIAISNLTANKAYSCTVTAADSNGESAPSKASNIVFPTATSPPTNSIPTITDWWKIIYIILMFASSGFYIQKSKDQ